MKTQKLHNMMRMIAIATWLWGSWAASAQTSIHNPLLYSDIPDPDVICVGKDYYMISTTMHMSPGAPIMHSRDMKHWEIISYVFEELHDSPANNLEGGNIYGRGQWAASLRYHEGLFYVFFGTGGKSYIYTAKNAKGPWTMKLQLNEYYHDASMLFDDDGRIFLIYNPGTIKVKEFAPDLSGFLPGGVDQDLYSLHDRCLLEGSHAYKIDGKYYITMIWWPRGGIRTQLCFRSTDIRGPYEHRVILSDDLGYAHHGVARGGIWQTKKGDWYSMLFQDHEGIGRIPCLLPVTWKDGWPMLGDENGKAPVDFTLPNIKEKGKSNFVTSDDFSSRKLHLAWQWNHNPDNTLWSLKERKGYMRLRTGKVVSNLFEARNTLTQRTVGPRCTGTVKMEVSQMLPGDRAGLCSFCSEPGGIYVEKTDIGQNLVMFDRKDIKATLPVQATTLWFRMECDFTTDTAHFSYSTDGQNFQRMGEGFHMIFSMAHFTGNKFAIFNYATKTAGGYVDVDEFILTNK